MGLGTTLVRGSSSLLLLDVAPMAVLPALLCRSTEPAAIGAYRPISMWCPAASEGAAGRAVDDDDVPSMPGVGVELGLGELLVSVRLALIKPSPLRPRSRVLFTAARTVLSLAVNTSGECTPVFEVRPSCCVGGSPREVAAARAVANAATTPD